MAETIRVGIMGYGNLGKGVEASLSQMPDMQLAAVFTRRAPHTISIQTQTARVLHVDDAEEHAEQIDVMVLCGGSATDLPEQAPVYASMFNTVDRYDTHAKILDYHREVDKVARANGKTCAVGIGWDPGLFSMMRVVGEAVLPHGRDYTFWGRGVSQGHSDAIRRIKGVKDAVQYTVPVQTAVECVRSGQMPELKTREKHIRECYVVAEEGEDTERIAYEIRSMPNYFADYDTPISFITEDELIREHKAMPHGGFVIRCGQTGMSEMHRQVMEFALRLESNPEFTSSVMVAYARAVYRLNLQGEIGARTVLDIPLHLLSPRAPEELLKSML